MPVSLSVGLEHLKLTGHVFCFLVCIVCELGSTMMVSCRGASRPRNPLYSPVHSPAPASSDLFTVPSPHVAELESHSTPASQIGVSHLAACWNCVQSHIASTGSVQSLWPGCTWWSLAKTLTPPQMGLRQMSPHFAECLGLSEVLEVGSSPSDGLMSSFDGIIYLVWLRSSQAGLEPVFRWSCIHAL